MAGSGGGNLTGPTQRFLDILDRLSQRAARAGWTEQDLAGDVGSLLSGVGRSTRYRALEQLGLSRNSGSRDVAQALINGPSWVTQHNATIREMQRESAFREARVAATYGPGQVNYRQQQLGLHQAAGIAGGLGFGSVSGTIGQVGGLSSSLNELGATGLAGWPHEPQFHWQ